MKEIEALIIEFVADQTGCPKEKIRMETSLIDDLGIAGDDADEFLVAFDERFGTNSTELDVKRLFGAEGIRPWDVFLIFLSIFQGLLRRCTGKPFNERSKPENDMRVSDLVEAASFKKWNKRFAAL